MKLFPETRARIEREITDPIRGAITLALTALALALTTLLVLILGK